MHCLIKLVFNSSFCSSFSSSSFYSHHKWTNDNFAKEPNPFGFIITKREETFIIRTNYNHRKTEINFCPSTFLFLPVNTNWSITWPTDNHIVSTILSTNQFRSSNDLFRACYHFPSSSPRLPKLYIELQPITTTLSAFYYPSNHHFHSFDAPP